MSGWETIQKIKHVEQLIDELGFKFAKSLHGDWTDNHGALSLKPKDADALPIYSRDAELFVGSLERLEDWLAGVRWARDYDMMLKISDAKKRARKEQDERNRKLLKTLKDGKIPDGIDPLNIEDCEC
jgi:hypothetical protein